MHDATLEQLRAQRDKLIQRRLRGVRRQRNWIFFVVGILFAYTFLPILAPILMYLGATGPANGLYTLYSPMCHQFAFRTFFLFGEQAAYPRETANDDLTLTFDERAAESEDFVALYTEIRREEILDSQGPRSAEAYEFRGAEELAEWNTALQLAARSFRGDEEMGYKMALCERDIAIYGAMTLAGIAFIFVRRRLRPAPLLLYLILGLAPIGIDGFSQLLGYAPFEFWPVRETTPEMRVITGGLFGFMNVWLAFPYLERSFRESADLLEESIAAMRADEG